MKGRRDWVEFKDVAARRRPNGTRVSLNPKGEFVFDRKTFELMNEPEAVVLLFDRATDTIGLKPSDPDSPNAVIVRTRHSRYNKIVRSLPFLKEHDIRLDRTVQFPTASIDEDGILCLNLRDRIATGRPVRKPIGPV